MQPKDWTKGFGWLALFGSMAGLVLIVCFTNTGWGPPGSATYQTYELLNRLMAVALLFMSAGWLGLAQKDLGGKSAWLAFIFSLVMAAATAAEFWLFSDQPYGLGGDLRNAAFSAFSLGGMMFDLSVTAIGVSIWRSNLAPRWVAMIFLLALSLDILGFITISIFLGATVLSLVVAWLLLRFLKPESAQSTGSETA